MPEPTDKVQVQSVSFGDRIEISYIEPRNVFTDGGIKAEVLIIPPGAVDAEVAELMDDARDLIDAYLMKVRNPLPYAR